VVRNRFKTGRTVAHLGESDMVELVDYKCASCGSLESFHRERNGISCKGCGSRIFMKLRRHGTKRLSAE
jgi:DNA-directed RNA polymerase subunit RPC12/RpoP